MVRYRKGHKNSKGEKAEWCIISHKTGRVISSHKSKSAAEKHLREIQMFKHMKNESMSLDEAKQILKNNGYKILKEDVNSDEAPAWEEGWNALSFNEKKAARWLMANFNKNNKINEEDLEKSLDVIIIEAILDHKKEWIEFMSDENIADMVYEYLNSLSVDELNNL